MFPSFAEGVINELVQVVEIFTHSSLQLIKGAFKLFSQLYQFACEISLGLIYLLLQLQCHLDCLLIVGDIYLSDKVLEGSHFMPFMAIVLANWTNQNVFLAFLLKANHRQLLIVLVTNQILDAIGQIFKVHQQLIQLAMQKIHHFKYVIVGGGISALQAALILAQNRQSFILLQASNRIGGRICSMPLEEALKDCPDNKYSWLQKVKDEKIECGATWICEDHGYMLHFANKFGFNLMTQYYEGKYVIAERPDKYHYYQDSSQYYQKYGPQIIHFISSLQTLRKRFQSLCDKKVDLSISEEESKELDQFYEKYDNMSAFEYIKQYIKDDFLCQLLAKEASSLVGCSTTAFSVLDLFDNQEEPLVSIKYNVGMQNANIDGFRLKEGLASICQRFKQQIQKVFDAEGNHMKTDDLIKLNTPVVSVRNNLNPVEVGTQQGDIYYCDKVIMGLPIATFHQIEFDHLSESKKILVNNQISSNITRMAFIFRQPFWRQHYSASVSFSHHFPMSQLVELTPENKEYGAIAFVFAADGFANWNSSILEQCTCKEGEGLKKQWYELNKKKSLKIIADLFLEGDTESEHLKEVAIFVKSMSESPYIKSTYNSFSAISTAFKINQLGQRVDPRADELNLVVLGSDFSDQFNGYMQGGIRIARKKVYALCGMQDPLKHLGEIKCYRQKPKE